MVAVGPGEGEGGSSWGPPGTGCSSGRRDVLEMRGGGVARVADGPLDRGAQNRVEMKRKGTARRGVGTGPRGPLARGSH